MNDPNMPAHDWVQVRSLCYAAWQCVRCGAVHYEVKAGQHAYVTPDPSLPAAERRVAAWRHTKTPLACVALAELPAAGSTPESPAQMSLFDGGMGA